MSHILLYQSINERKKQYFLLQLPLFSFSLPPSEIQLIKKTDLFFTNQHLYSEINKKLH